MKRIITAVLAAGIGGTAYMALRPSAVVNPPPIPTLIMDALDLRDWHVVFPAGAVTSNFTWQAQYSTGLNGAWQNFGEWWSGDTNIIKMQPTLFLRLVGTSNSPIVPKAKPNAGLIGG